MVYAVRLPYLRFIKLPFVHIFLRFLGFSGEDWQSVAIKWALHPEGWIGYCLPAHDATKEMSFDSGYSKCLC